MFRAIDHAGITVRDLERSVAFYRDVVGLVEQVRFSNGGPLQSQLIGVERDVRIDIVFMHPPGNTACRLELLTVTPPGEPSQHTATEHAGSVHVCLETADMAGTVARLKDRGVSLIGEPIALGDPADPGYLCYFADPDGVRIELIQWPKSRQR